MEILSPDGVIVPKLANDPVSPVNGAKWYNKTTNKFRVRENGVTRDEDTGGGGGISNNQSIINALIFG